MAQRRETPTPGGTRRPGQRGNTPRGRVAAQIPAESGDTRTDAAGTSAGRTNPAQGPPASAGGGPTPPRTRVTGRAVLLVVVVFFLGISFASSMRAYVEQRDHIRELKSDIARSEATIAELEREKRRWEDPAYVKAQARATLGYLMPGETGYQVLDENGEPLDPEADLHDPEEVGQSDPDPWWEDVWGSVELAGVPPQERSAKAPKRIDGVKQNEREQQ